LGGGSPLRGISGPVVWNSFLEVKGEVGNAAGNALLGIESQTIGGFIEGSSMVRKPWSTAYLVQGGSGARYQKKGT